jgi:hypothetical protein
MPEAVAAAPAAPAASVLGGELAPKAAPAPAAAKPAVVDAKAAPAVDAAAAAPDAAKVDADKATAEAAAELQLKLPEGFKEDESFGSFKELAKKHGLESEQAQAVVDLYAGMQKKQAEAMEAERVALTKEWEAELRADKDFGGAKFDANVQNARKAIKAFGDADLKEFFNSHPLGNHPGLTKLLAKIGAALGEDKLEGMASEGGALPASNDKAFHQAMYPKSYAQMTNGSR